MDPSCLVSPQGGVTCQGDVAEQKVTFACDQPIGCFQQMERNYELYVVTELVLVLLHLVPSLTVEYSTCVSVTHQVYVIQGIMMKMTLVL